MDANFFRSRRDALDLTQKQIADQLNKTVQTVSAWERGVAVPLRETWPEVAAVYKVSVARLVREIAELPIAEKV